MWRTTLPRRFMAKMGDLPDVRPPSYHLLYNSVTTWKHTTVTIDCMYDKVPMHASAYFLWSRSKDSKEGMAAAFIDNNTTHAMPAFDVEIANKQKNCDVTYDHVKYVIITHVHLDHAGATGELLRKCPNATVLCHPRAMRHLVDPSYLIKAVKEVYGEARYAEMYGEIIPCPAERVRAVADGERIELVPERVLQFFHVTGHANHHFVIHDPTTSSLFAGDAFGVRYPWLELYNCREPFFHPSSSPSDFNAANQRKAVAQIAALAPRRVYLTHYGMCEDVETGATQLLKALDVYEGVQGKLSLRLQAGVSDADVVKEGEAAMRAWMEAEMRTRGLHEDDADFWNFFQNEININAQGLMVAAKRNIKDGIKEATPKETVPTPTPVDPVPVPVAPPLVTPVVTPTSPQAKGPSPGSKAVASMTTVELQAAFRAAGLEKFSDVLKAQDIDGSVFVDMSAEDVNQLFPNLTYGGRQKILRLQKTNAPA